jgi:hypothetical protein
MQRIKLNTTTRGIPLFAASSVDLQVALDASALTFTVAVIKADGTSQAGAGSGGISNAGITQPSLSLARGVCYYTPGASDVNVYGPTVFVFTASGMETRREVVDVVAHDPYDPIRAGLTALRPDPILVGAAVTGTLTAAAFTTNLAIASNALKNEAHCRFVTGALAGEVQKITGYAAGVLSFTAGFSAAPANLDAFVVVNG